ncbi:MAG: response regulator transcription factor [Actinobacteria bacterium]|nr:response regulator transcription factor [Actinomycetota bacterium]
MKPLPLRTVIADDHRLFRQGLVSLMRTRADLVTIVGEAGTPEEAVVLCEQLQPDLILLDIYLAGGSGLDAAAEIRSRFPDVAVVMLTASELGDHLDRAIRLGASGYLLKDLDAAELFDLVEGVSRDEVAVTRAIASRMLKRLAVTNASEGGRESDGPSLTTREVEVLRLVARGASNAQIAAELHVTVNTAKAHLKRILEKLNVQNRTQAATYAMRRGLVPEDPGA